MRELFAPPEPFQPSLGLPETTEDRLFVAQGRAIGADLRLIAERVRRQTGWDDSRTWACIHYALTMTREDGE